MDGSTDRRIIILARHGRVAPSTRRFGGPAAFRDFLAAYDRAPLDPSRPPPPDLAALAGGSATVFASSLPRSLASAAVLAPGRPARSLPLFDEAPLPVPSLPLHLPMVAWTVVARALWLAGAGGCESAAAVRDRAAQACTVLEDAVAAGPVFLAGHGWMNRLLSHTLTHRGWRVLETTGHGPWSRRVLAAPSNGQEADR
ncbi:broad specificity phosphatase PhoE [Azospirillum fermentarium]|uniref:hypothetical protein n=1 Tax=Azospirillum fermentarium TaxID=1233114 RepID=UPI0022269403|nr:hypothetical protein [Azospirillum fermentarium]MCW2246443.1 broad specificity phosphatase PhoE [Azospirillum fermentarium]